MQPIYLNPFESELTRYLKILTVTFLVFSQPFEYSNAAESNVDLFQYLSPVPGSSLVSPDNNIIIRPGGFLDAGSIRNELVTVLGSRSGRHYGRLLLSDDQKTLIFLPDDSFALGERVSVLLEQGVRLSTGDLVSGLSFDFTVRPREAPMARSAFYDEIARGANGTKGNSPPSRWSFPSDALMVTGCDTLPAGYPLISVDTLDNPDAGLLFVSPFNIGSDGHLVIMDNSGIPVFYRTVDERVLDFKPQGNGTLTYGTFSDIEEENKFYALDSSYALIDSFTCGNGYSTDTHELVVMENDHSLLMSYDHQIINMDSLIAGGDSAATVVGLIIQELDASKNVVFQWRSWDHISILDGSVSPLVDLTSDFIDYIHGNAIEPDDDGNLLISSRHINEITKIDRQTGEIIWRWGLNAINNDFTFINDKRGFSHQHDIRRLPNGNVTLFDNGNFLDPLYSRALEYTLDEQDMTATLVWEYRDDPDVYGGFMGSVGRFESGGSLVCWGGVFGAPGVVELHADGSKAMQLSFPDTLWSYRAFRSTWQTNRFTVSSELVDFGTVSVGDSSLQSLIVSNNSPDPVNISCFANSDSTFSTLWTPPVLIPPNSSVGLTLKFKPLFEGAFSDRLYVRSVDETELVAQVVELLGQTDSVTSVDPEEPVPSQYSLYQNYPNPFNPSTTIRYDLPVEGVVDLTVYDQLGQEVVRLVGEFQKPGSHVVVWDATGLATGMYFYRLRSGEYSRTRTLLLLK